MTRRSDRAARGSVAPDRKGEPVDGRGPSHDFDAGACCRSIWLMAQ